MGLIAGLDMMVEEKTLPLAGTELQSFNIEPITSVTELFQFIVESIMQRLCSYSYIQYKYLIFQLENIFSVYMFGLYNYVSSTLRLKVSTADGKWVCKNIVK
jgi:hypothetical protein